MGLLFAGALMGLPLAYAIWSLVQGKDELEIVHHARRDATEDRSSGKDRAEPQQPGALAQADHRMSPSPIASPSAGA